MSMIRDIEDDEPDEPHVSEELINRGKAWRHLATSKSVATHLGHDLRGQTANRSTESISSGPRSPLSLRRRMSVMTEQMILSHKPLAPNVDKYDVAACYVRDALHGRRPATCIHSRWTLRAMKVQRATWFNWLFNAAVVLHCALPVLEVPPCGAGYVSSPASVGRWVVYGAGVRGLPRPTVLLSSAVEVVLTAFYVLELYLVWCVRDRCSGRRFIESATIWPAVRMALVGLLAADLTGFFVYEAWMGKYWFRWGRIVLPHMLTLKRTYLQLFSAGLVRMVPRVLPVMLLISFATSFFGYVGYLVFHNKTFGLHLPFLEGLGFFQTLFTSVRTMLRVFTSIPAMLDIEELYHDVSGIRIFMLVYALISVVFLGSLVVAVANKLFQQQNAQAYMAVRTQRALALRCAFTLLRGPDNTVSLSSWVNLMEKLRPDMSQEAAAVLFRTVCTSGPFYGAFEGSSNAIQSQSQSLSQEKERTKRAFSGGMGTLSKDEFYEVCALAGADVRVKHSDKRVSVIDLSSIRRDSKVAWMRQRSTRRLRRNVRDVIEARCSLCYGWVVIKPYPIIFNVMVLLQAVQLVLMALSDEAWTNRLGAALLCYFWIDSLLHLFVLGPMAFFARWDLTCSMALNVIVFMYRCVWWPSGVAAKDVFTVIVSVRVTLLWRLLKDYDGSHTDVASRVMLIVPALVRAFVVLLSIVYSFSVAAYGLLCGSAIGAGNLDEYKTEPLVVRWTMYKDVISFASFPYSFKCMLDIQLVSNWPLFMDAAAAVTGQETLMRTFFYTYKVYIFYICSPVMVGFIVHAYMATRSAHDSARRSAASVGFVSSEDEEETDDRDGAEGFSDGHSDASPSKRRRSQVQQIGRTMSAVYFSQDVREPPDTKAARDIHELEGQLELMGKELAKRDDTIKRLRKRLVAGSDSEPLLSPTGTMNGGGGGFSGGGSGSVSGSVSGASGPAFGRTISSGGHRDSYGTLRPVAEMADEESTGDMVEEQEVEHHEGGLERKDFAARGEGDAVGGGGEGDLAEDDEPWVRKRRTSSLLML